MKNVPYHFTSVDERTYCFTSEGTQRIRKVVEFSETEIQNVVNLGFGDVTPHGDFSDMIISNNGDILKVMTTVVHIVLHFTSRYPSVKVMFTGSSPARMKLYERILRDHFNDFKKSFRISAFSGSHVFPEEIEYQPGRPDNYFTFFIKRKI